jgi:hypothetical protein
VGYEQYEYLLWKSWQSSGFYAKYFILNSLTIGTFVVSKKFIYSAIYYGS